ncbi:MAG: hypothetical protein NTZ44_02770 [Candidatus Nomurabacteria bacterium]|nr:hypothetical protein [Candidatus Nomurabacteria bacterium]
MKENEAKIHFSDFFKVSHDLVENYGALDISLLSDNPAFVDPFLIFYSKKSEYEVLHKQIIEYIFFLKRNSDNGNYLETNYKFPEVSQTWLGYSRHGNKGRGLGPKFAKELDKNLTEIFFELQDSKITKSPHLEKLCLVAKGVGVDNISDFTLNLVKGYLIKYTKNFCKENVNPKFLNDFGISRIEFDFEKGIWIDGVASLPFIYNEKGLKEYVLLTPKDILVKEEDWISKSDFLKHDSVILNRIDNQDLRDKINQYFNALIPVKINKKGKKVPDNSQKNRKEALIETAKKYTILLEYYIRYKENEGSPVVKRNLEDVSLIKDIFYSEARKIVSELKNDTEFYKKPLSSLEESIKKIKIFKHYLEDRNNCRIFWDGEKLKKIKEDDIGILLDLIFNESLFSVDNQVNNGRGPSDVKVSMGRKDCTIIEIKLASNPQMPKNLKNQLDIYKKANDTYNGVYLIVYFTNDEKVKMEILLKKLNMFIYIDKYIFLIDCRKKISASKVNEL